MKIRNARLRDLDTVYALVCELEAKTLDKEAFALIYEAGLDDPNVHYLLAEALPAASEPAAALGFMSIQVRTFLHRVGTVTEVMELVIPATVRSRGIGQQLFDRALAIARSNGCVQLELCSNVLRTRAHLFYERNGMKKYHYKLTLPMHLDGEDLNLIGR